MVKNPSACEFVNNDPDASGFELDFVRKSDNVIVQTLVFAIGSTTIVGGKVHCNVNVMPMAKGTYYTVVRALIGAIESVNSAPSADWERAAGPPSDVVML